MNNERDELVNVQQAAAIKNVDETSIRRAIKGGRLKAQRLGKFYAIRRGDLYDWTPERRGRKRSDEGRKGGVYGLSPTACGS